MHTIHYIQILKYILTCYNVKMSFGKIDYGEMGIGEQWWRGNEILVFEQNIMIIWNI